MQSLRPLHQIPVPSPAPEQCYQHTVFGRSFAFRGLKRLLAAADISKAGDRNAGLAAHTELEREVARLLLSSLSLQHLYDHPLTDEQGCVDSVMRINYDIDLETFGGMASWTVGELKDRLLLLPGEALRPLGRALTGVMVAAVAKLCDAHELILIASKLGRPTRARTRLGLPGTLSSRLQPNHPTDDLRGMGLLLSLGLSIGAGDALLGVNPAVDTVENISGILRYLDGLRRRFEVPTQICVLGHIKTQLACLEQGAPVEILFQSLAGTERANLTEFDIHPELLDRGYQRMAERGPLVGVAEQFTYFETGQGSEFTYGKHNGIDMTTLEALCYGLARRYDPFMVNNVTGFIGPETHLDNFEMIFSNLQDHFMGKLLGLPMGMAPCYTLHSRITLEGQQLATQLLTAAGAHYYMDVCLNTDRMLAYFDTSGHDVQTLREVYQRTPTPEYLEWGLQRGIFERTSSGQVQRGPSWGDLRPFCARDELERLARVTPALHGLDLDRGLRVAGPRTGQAVTRLVRLHQAAAREAIFQELDLDTLEAQHSFRRVRTAAGSKEAHLGSAELGAHLAAESRASLSAEPHPVQLVVSDGLSAAAVHHNLDTLLPVLLEGLETLGFSYGQPLLVPYGRVKLAEPLAELLDAALVIYLIGERPGGDALAACSLSAYLVYRLRDAATRERAGAFSGNPDIHFEYTVISNIYEGGLPPLEAGGVVLEKVQQILHHHAAGNRLEALLQPERADTAR